MSTRIWLWLMVSNFWTITAKTLFSNLTLAWKIGREEVHELSYTPLVSVEIHNNSLLNLEGSINANDPKLSDVR